MKSTFATLTLTLAAVLSLTALAQTGNAAGPTTPAVPVAGPAKIGVINMNVAIQASNEGQRELQAMEKRFEPKQTELNNRAKQLQNDKDQLKTQGDKLNDEARATLISKIQTEEKSLQRDGDDFNTDVQNQQNEVVQKILKKMAPVIVKYAQENNLSLLVDSSNPWPQSPFLWNAPSVDITKAIVDVYNAQSGVPAPASAPAAPSAGRSTTPPARKPATTSTTPPK